jgi:XRE family transcriptional regulator, regulator of sulfur utilization
MEDLTLLVAQNLKRMREERKLSLDRLAELTGVSKSMLGQIERGESSPTVATLWKISNGLRVSFTTLLSAPQSDTAVVHQSDIAPLLEDDGKYRLYPFFPIEEGRRFEVYSFEIDGGGILKAESHAAGTQEFLTVFDGEMCVLVGGEEYRLTAGDSIRYRADRAHSYLNEGEAMAKASLVIQYDP